MSGEQASPLTLRVAREEDRPALEALVECSVRGLMTAEHSPEQLEASLRFVFGVDGELLADGTYFAAESGGRLVGAGGWSRRRTLFGGDVSVAGRAVGPPLDPARDSARIRAFFVDPGHARRGIGRRLLERCETGARDAGFRTLELVSTLTGEALYRSSGFELVERFEIPLPGGLALPVARMRRAV